MLSIICLKLERHCNKEDICLLDWEETTRFIQANDTDLHDHLKGRHRNKEMALMLNILEVDKDKVPSPSREHMIAMPLAAWKETDVDFIAVFKKFLWPTRLMSQRIFWCLINYFPLLMITCWSTEDSY